MGKKLKIRTTLNPSGAKGSKKSVIQVAKTELAVEQTKKTLISKAKTSIPNSIYPWSKLMKMRFAYTGRMDTGASPTPQIYYQRQDHGFAVDLFNLNSIAYPRFGSQVFGLTGDLRPQGYDQMLGAYGKYKVYGAYVILKIYDPSSDGAIIGLKKSSSDDSQRLNANPINNMTVKKSVFQPIILNDTGSQVITRKYYFSIQELDGLSKAQFANDLNQYEANLLSSPSSRPKFELAIASDDANQKTCQYTITIDYLTRFFRRETIPTSTIPPS